MKPYVLGALILLLAGCSAVFAAETADSVDWGTKAAITGVTWQASSRAFAEPEKKNILLGDASLAPLRFVRWTPDGKSIIYSDQMTGIWSIPAEGGTPKVIYDGVLLYPYNDFYFAITQGCIPGGFSLDGRYFYYSYIKFDTSRGAVITVDAGANLETGAGCSVTQPPECQTVVRLDMETGNTEVIATGMYVLAVSRSGETMCMFSSTEMKTYFMNMTTGTTWDVPIVMDSCCFTADGKAVVYCGSDQKLHRMPITGGDPEKLPAYAADIPGMALIPFDCSPDGTWILYKEVDTENTYSNTVKNPDGIGTQKYSKLVSRLCKFNLKTGETVEVFPPVPSVTIFSAQFSNDGSRFSYTKRDQDVCDFIDQWGIYTHAFESGSEADTQLAVNEAVPSAFALTGNHPNPFNPSTAISFSLEKAGTVELAIYDITGRKVRDLANGHMAPGRHEAVWNGCDDRGIPVASGVYFSRLVSGGTPLSHRMLLMK